VVRKTVWVIIFILVVALLLSFGGNQPVRADSADSISFPSGITVFSPVNKTYNSQHLILNLTLYSAGSMGSIDSQISMTYSLAGRNFGQVPLSVSNPGLHIVTNAAGTVALPKLSEGSHTLTIYLYGHNQKTFQPKYVSYVNTIYFSIDCSPLNLTVLSPKNTTYANSDMPLNFALNKQANATYCLDQNDQAALNGNCTLTDLSIGEHNITITAEDAAGNTVTQTANFTITNPTPTLEPLTIAVIILAAGLIIETILFILVKRKKTRG